MTPKKRLFELKKELRRVQRKIYKYTKLKCDKYNIYADITDYCFPRFVNYYEIITSEGIRYVIDRDTETFPNINFRDIVYIRKNFCICFWTKNGKHLNNLYQKKDQDSITGYYDHTYEYGEFIRNKFNVINYYVYD